MPGLHFASLRLFRELHDVDPRLYEIVMELLEHHWPDPAKPARITCIYRTEAEEAAAGGRSGVHTIRAPYRAVDIGAREFTPAQIATAAAAINARWRYDPDRPEMLVCFAAPHGTGPHFHCQVHSHTRRLPNA